MRIDIDWKRTEKISLAFCLLYFLLEKKAFTKLGQPVFGWQMRLYCLDKMNLRAQKHEH